MKEVTFRQAINQAMSEEIRKDINIYLMGEEVAEYNGAYKASKGMLAEFGDKRIIDTPISELGFSGIGIGSAMNGCKPIIEFMTFNFSLVAIDQIINNAAKISQMSGGQWNISIVFRGPTGSSGQLGATHSQSFDSWYAYCPGLKVVIASNPFDAKGLLKSAILDDTPVIFLESENIYGYRMNIPIDEYTLPIGKAYVKKEGKDATLVSFGKIMKVALSTAENLAHEGLEVEVIDLRSVRPIDHDTILKSVKKTNRLVILEESWPFCSIASEISYFVHNQAFDYLDAPIEKINVPDKPAPYAPNLIDIWYPALKKVSKAIKKTFYL